MLQFTPFVCFAAALSASPDLPPSPSPADTLPRLNLVWSDSHRLFPYGFQSMADEVEKIFSAVGSRSSDGKGRCQPGTRLLRDCGLSDIVPSRWMESQ